MQNVAVLFTNNLRLHDNSVLEAANKRGNLVFPLYFHDIKWALGSEFETRNIGPFRAKFLCESVNNLKKNLENINSHLTILRGDTINLVVEYAKKYKISKIYVQQATGIFEIKQLENLKKLLEKEGINLYQIWDHTLVHKDDLDFHMSDMPQVFTSFRKSVEKNSDIIAPIDTPITINSKEAEKTDLLSVSDFGYTDFTIDSRRAIEFIGGEDCALERLKHYFWKSKCLSNYKNTRNGLIGADYSSKFSPWLAHGCISPRFIYSEIKKYEKEIDKNSSTYWLIFELLWRDFFQFIFLQDPMRFFNNYYQSHEGLNNDNKSRKFNKWKHGRLGVPFVDANMRELNLTGFMSNRGRQIVASYLVNDLNVDWRLGAKYFENVLVDYDIASNWGNWAYVAGVGNDPRDNRYFNIEKQANTYDSKGEYRKLWNH